jgi:uncharacterized protein
MANQIVWCDIPVSELDRAVRFYSAVLGTEVKKQNVPGMTIAVLPHNDGEVGGCLLQSPEEKPSAQGLMIYLDATGRLDGAIAAVTANGGKILQPKHARIPMCYFGQRREPRRVTLRVALHRIIRRLFPVGAWVDRSA